MNKIFSSIAAVAFLVATVVVSPVQAASLTGMSDTLSTIKQSVVANHTINFTIPTGSVGIADAGTVVVTFPASMDSFDFSTMGVEDVDLTVAGAEQTLVAGAPGANEWQVAFADGARTLTLTAGTLDTNPAATNQLVIEIGTNATAPGAGNTQLVNPAAGTHAISIATAVDSGVLAVVTTTTNEVTVTATVDPILTFTLADYGTDGNTNVSLGTIDNDASNATEGSGQDGNIITVATNAGSGITVKAYDEALGLRTSSFTGPRVNAAGDGQFNDVTVGAFPAATEAFGYQVGVGVAPTGNFNPLTGVTPVTLNNFTGPVASGVVNVLYQAQTVATTPAGSYNDVITYTVTPTF